MQSSLISQYGNEKRWVNWKLEEREGKKTKVPVQPNGSLASSTKEATWNTYDMLDPKLGSGIIFTPECTLLGIDLDHVIDEVGTLHPRFDALIEKADTYTEFSPSRTGLHLYLAIDEPVRKLQKNKKKYGDGTEIELYVKGRFFTTTHDSWGEIRPVRTVTKAELREILATTGYPWEAEEKKGEGVAPAPNTMDADETVRKMLASKNGAAIERLWSGDTSAHMGDESRADMALLAHLAFWTGKDAGKMEALWLSSGLGVRDKVKKRQDYRTRSIEAAIANCREVYTPRDPTRDAEGTEIEYLCTYNKDGDKKIAMVTENIVRILTHHPEFAGTVRSNTFRACLQIKDGETWRDFEEGDDVRIQTRISIIEPAFMRVTKGMVWDAMMRVASMNTHDSAREYFESLVWDGTPRVDTWLARAYGTPDDEYHKVIGKNWLIGLTQRVAYGRQFDTVLVIEGVQGIKKSRSLRELCALTQELWHTETDIEAGSKDFYMILQGRMVVEFSEGETLSRTEVKRMKSIITREYDSYRAPYERATHDHQRRCGFAMTTNQEQYLKDESGNRRWLPFCAKTVDIEWILDNRGQLMAEAFARGKQGESYWEIDQQMLEDAHSGRIVSSPVEEQVLEWWAGLPLEQREDGVRTLDAWRGINGGSTWGRTLSKKEEMEVTQVFRDVLKLKKKQTGNGAKKAMRWFERDDMKGAIPFDPALFREEQSF